MDYRYTFLKPVLLHTDITIRVFQVVFELREPPTVGAAFSFKIIAAHKCSRISFGSFFFIMCGYGIAENSCCISLHSN